MMLRKQIREIAGETYRFALFYNFPGGLRFELSGAGSPLDQVLTALRKATAICDDVFSGEAHIFVHLQACIPVSPDLDTMRATFEPSCGMPRTDSP